MVAPSPSPSPSVIGARAEMAVTSALHRVGMDVFVPVFGAHSRIDLVTSTDGLLRRVQIKTSVVSQGALTFRTCSNTGNVGRDYRGDIDSFGVYSPELNLVYLVPVEDTPTRLCNLRLEPARNNQAAGIRWAADYLVGPP